MIEERQIIRLIDGPQTSNARWWYAIVSEFIGRKPIVQEQQAIGQGSIEHLCLGASNILLVAWYSHTLSSTSKRTDQTWQLAVRDP